MAGVSLDLVGRFAECRRRLKIVLSIWTSKSLNWRSKNTGARLEAKKGSMVAFSEGGPVGMAVIDAIVGTIEAREKRIAALEAKPSGAGNDFTMG